jgi:hypothetical protein
MMSFFPPQQSETQEGRVEKEDKKPEPIQVGREPSDPC